jgi:hypothetical protein
VAGDKRSKMFGESDRETEATKHFTHRRVKRRKLLRVFEKARPGL